jgi:hypothetical protein
MNSQFNINNFNSFIQAASQQIACGTECQQQQQAENLKNIYLNAQSNLALASPQYDVAKKNYYVYVDGQNGYNQMMETEYSNKAEVIANKYKDSYNEEISKIKSLLKTYDGLLINFRNVVDLYTQYKEENLQLYKKLKTQSNDVLTNERKTYYEDQNIDSLNNFYYYILLIIYIITVICYVIFSLIYPSQSSWKVRGFLFILFLALPFISTFVLGKIIQFIYWVFGLLPKNVYL